jgi:hypothetical protein
VAELYVESGIGAHVDDATLCWLFNLDHWGLCGQGIDEGSALHDLHNRALDAYRSFLNRHGEECPDLDSDEIVERIHGDEQAFERDRKSATHQEVERTLTMLA